MSQPIKRHPSLQPWSRDHHDGLLLCFKIREGIKRGVEIRRIKQYIDWFWQNHLIPHFREEEELLFPLLGQNHPEVQTALEQHTRLKGLFTSPDTDRETLITIERELEQHIRFEERVLFNTIQTMADPKRLSGFRSDNRNTASCEVWPDPFWTGNPG